MDSILFQSSKQNNKEDADNTIYDLGDELESKIFLNVDQNGLYGIATFTGKDNDLCL